MTVSLRIECLSGVVRGAAKRTKDGGEREKRAGEVREGEVGGREERGMTSVVMAEKSMMG
jgi:hypothetical protein